MCSLIIFSSYVISVAMIHHGSAEGWSLVLVNNRNKYILNNIQPFQLKSNPLM
jgi:hypothetical protein